MGDADERTKTFAERRRAIELTTPVSVRVPDPLLEELDDLWAEAGFDSRSAFVRALLRGAAEHPGEAAALTE
jgi:Arc/MetJ-type ribon-helix-helix transcriptional regulator